jgi:hypothetical protein
MLALRAYVAESCSEAGRTMLATPATAWQVKRRDGAVVSLRVPQSRSQLQPRVRISARSCAQGPAVAGGYRATHVRLRCQRAANWQPGLGTANELPQRAAGYNAS